MTEQDDRYYTVDEAARSLEISPACVRQLLRAGELEGERREERIEGVLGPWRIPERATRALREGDPGILRAKRRNVCVDEATTAAEPPSGGAIAGTPSEEATVEASSLGSFSEALKSPVREPERQPDGEAEADYLPSEASELLSESVREVREKAEALRKELELLEGRLEAAEIAEFALQENLRREKERADRERERADGLRAELEAARAAHRREPPPEEESGRWVFKG